MFKSTKLAWRLRERRGRAPSPPFVDAEDAAEHHDAVAEVVPFPPLGDVFIGQDAAGKVLRVTWHPEIDRLVLSIWRNGCCASTVRLSVSDASRLIAALAEGLGEVASSAAEHRPAPSRASCARQG